MVQSSAADFQCDFTITSIHEEPCHLYTNTQLVTVQFDNRYNTTIETRPRPIYYLVPRYRYIMMCYEDRFQVGQAPAADNCV
jgi:hypothetical protein